MHHKRHRPKHQRAGCLYCKPHKDERLPQRSRAELERAIREAEVVHPSELPCNEECCLG